jgi:hypothetical protein
MNRGNDATIVVDIWSETFEFVGWRMRKRPTPLMIFEGEKKEFYDCTEYSEGQKVYMTRRVEGLSGSPPKPAEYRAQACSNSIALHATGGLHRGGSQNALEERRVEQYGTIRWATAYYP